MPPLSEGSCSWLAELAVEQGKPEEALGWYCQALGVYERLLCGQHPETQNLCKQYEACLRGVKKA